MGGLKADGHQTDGMSMRTALASILQRPVRDQSGTALAEALVAIVVGLLVMGATVAVYMVAVRSESTTSARSEALARGEVAMERMSRELRQGTSIASSAPRTISFETYVRGLGPRRVRYDCSTAPTVCRRSVAPSGTNTFGTAAEFVSGLEPAGTIFTAAAAAAGGVRPRPEVAVQLRLLRPSDNAGTRTVAAELSDGVALRNATPVP